MQDTSRICPNCQSKNLFYHTRKKAYVCGTCHYISSKHYRDYSGQMQKMRQYDQYLTAAYIAMQNAQDVIKFSDHMFGIIFTSMRRKMLEAKIILEKGKRT